jgi:hypothetical protein
VLRVELAHLRPAVCMHVFERAFMCVCVCVCVCVCACVYVVGRGKHGERVPSPFVSNELKVALILADSCRHRGEMF